MEYVEHNNTIGRNVINEEDIEGCIEIISFQPVKKSSDEPNGPYWPLGWIYWDVCLASSKNIAMYWPNGTKYLFLRDKEKLKLIPKNRMVLTQWIFVPL